MNSTLSATSVDPCASLNSDFLTCLSQNSYVMTKCQSYMDKYTACETKTAQEKQRQADEEKKRKAEEEQRRRDMQNPSLNIFGNNTNNKNPVHYNDDDDDIVEDPDDNVYKYNFRKFQNNEQPGTWQYYLENVKENINHEEDEVI